MVTHSDIDTSIYTSNRAYGGVSGCNFKQVDSRHIVTSIQAWRGPWQLRGLKVTFSDDKSHTFGTTEGSATPVFDLQLERLAKVVFYDSPETSSGGYYRSGGFTLETDKGRSFSATSMKQPSTKYSEIVGSGILCGVFGSQGSDIDNLGFALHRSPV